MPILIIDDDPTNLLLLSAMARQASALPLMALGDPRQALQWCARQAQAQAPALVLVDYRMPHLSGIEFIAAFRAMAGMADVPIIMITTENERSVRQQALAAGATDFLAKPFDTVELRLRLRNLLALSQAQLLLADRARLLQHEVAAAVAVIAAREQELVTRLALAAEFRDPETGGHILRMARYALLIARGLRLPLVFQHDLVKAAPMHDVGKLATPDSILLKPGRLTPDEMAVMRRHAELGAELLAGSSSPLLQLAEEIARAHHEKFDGSGYPYGLAGAAIPLSARIVAVADVFDALTSERPYKRAWPLDAARAYLVEQRAHHFCPACVDAFLDGWHEVLDIHASLADAPEPVAEELACS